MMDETKQGTGEGGTGGPNLSPQELRAFAELVREQQPPADLEDRTVAMLRRTGHLPTPISVRIGGTAHGARLTAHRAWWLTGAVAAGLAIFASGLALGQYLGTRNAALVVSASSTRSAAELADHVERAGSVYVAALAALSQLPATAQPEARDSVRRVALKVLGDAAQEFAIIAPDDPLAAAVLRGLNQRSRNQEPTAPSRSVVWY